MFFNEENEDNDDGIGDEIVNHDKDQDEDEIRVERRLREAKNELEGDELMEGEDPVDEEEDLERDSEDGDEENDTMDDDDDDDAFENETEYFDRMKNEKEARNEEENKVVSVADPSKLKSSTKKVYASCERGNCIQDYLVLK